MPSSDSCSVLVTLVLEREHCRPLAASWSRASTGSGSSPSVGGSGKGGVKVGEGQDQDVPVQKYLVYLEKEKVEILSLKYLLVTVCIVGVL